MSDGARNIALELFHSLEWRKGDPDSDLIDCMFLCLVDWQHFNPKLTAESPYLIACIWNGDCFMSPDEGCWAGPVKCVRAWALL